MRHRVAGHGLLVLLPASRMSHLCVWADTGGLCSSSESQQHPLCADLALGAPRRHSHALFAVDLLVQRLAQPGMADRRGADATPPSRLPQIAAAASHAPMEYCRPYCTVSR